MKKGYSHEDFREGKYTVYKFTRSEKRFGFVLGQFEWLNAIKKVFPQYAFDKIQLIRSADEIGYSMNKVKSVELTEVNANALIDIVKTIALSPDEVNRKFDGRYDIAPASIKTDSFDVDARFRTFAKYVNYLGDIVLKNPQVFYDFDWYKFESELFKFENFADKSISFYHGDMTIDNVLWDGNKYTLIDPNFKSDSWPSYLLDLSKLYQETRFDNKNLFHELKFNIQRKFNFGNAEMYFLELLEIGHYIRMMPYVQNFEEIYKLKYTRFVELTKNF